MSLQDASDIINKFDPLVINAFKETLAKNLITYQENPTKLKLKNLIINLPLGALIDSSDLKCIGERSPGYRDVINMLLKRDFSKFTTEPKDDL